MAGCGESPCHVAFPTTSPFVDDVSGVLDALGGNAPSTVAGGGDDGRPKASDVLAGLARAISGPDDDGDGNGGPVAATAVQ